MAMVNNKDNFYWLQNMIMLLLIMPYKCYYSWDTIFHIFVLFFVAVVIIKDKAK